MVETGRTLGALHDDRSDGMFKFTIDAKDICGHDRVLGGDAWSIKLEVDGVIHGSILHSCPLGVTSSPGVCEMPGEENRGLYVVRFATTKVGWYDVYSKLSHTSWENIGKFQISA